eukprot:1729576-Prymnesium_polylepis.2
MQKRQGWVCSMSVVPQMTSRCTFVVRRPRSRGVARAIRPAFARLASRSLDSSYGGVFASACERVCFVSPSPRVGRYVGCRRQLSSVEARCKNASATSR